MTKRRPKPLQTMILQVQPSDDRRREAERVNRAQQVMPVAGDGQLTSAHRAARLVHRLQHHHIPARSANTLASTSPL